ncbi:MAG TPA: GNAT family N-acetyltransferase [Gemmatimonadales bacterium]|nr:GNAT family N-acetyltransferase [Gemmatimonadales bacterium]
MPDRITYRILGPGDAALLADVAVDVFDDVPVRRWTAEFLMDARHHLAVALQDGTIVGMASAVHYVHPDKPPELWINEVGVSPANQGAGIGRRLLETLFARARELGCVQAWVLTEPDNFAALRLYRAAGGTEAPPLVMYEFPLGSDDGRAT